MGDHDTIKTHKRRGKLVDPGDLVTEQSLSPSYRILGQGEGRERLLVKARSKKARRAGELEEVDGDCFRFVNLLIWCEDS